MSWAGNVLVAPGSIAFANTFSDGFTRATLNTGNWTESSAGSGGHSMDNAHTDLVLDTGATNSSYNRIQCTHGAEPDEVTKLTVWIRAKATMTSDDCTCLFGVRYDGSNSIDLYHHNSDHQNICRFKSVKAGTSTEHGSLTVTYEEWHTYKFVVTDGNVKVYVDGTLLDEITTNVPSNTVVSPQVYIDNRTTGASQTVNVDWIRMACG